MTVLKPLIDKMEARSHLGVPNVVSETRWSASTGGSPNRSATSCGPARRQCAYILHQRTGECMHASNIGNYSARRRRSAELLVYRLLQGRQRQVGFLALNTLEMEVADQPGFRSRSFTPATRW